MERIPNSQYPEQQADLYNISLEESTFTVLSNKTYDVFKNIYELVRSICDLAISVLLIPCSCCTQPKSLQNRVEIIQKKPPARKVSRSDSVHMGIKTKETLIQALLADASTDDVKIPSLARVPGGIQNKGNTCFLAAALQVFFRSEYIVKRILKAQELSKSLGGPKTVFDELADAYNTTAVRGKTYNNTYRLREFLSSSPEGHNLDGDLFAQDDTLAMVQTIFGLLKIPCLPLAFTTTYNQPTKGFIRDIVHNKDHQYLTIEGEDGDSVDVSQAISYKTERETTLTPPAGFDYCPKLEEGTTVTQTVSLKIVEKADIPQIIPVRKTEDMYVDGRMEKKSFSVENSNTIAIPILNSEQYAVYHRIGVALHTGSANFGHWRALTYVSKDRPSILFDDSSSRIARIDDEIKSNGSFFLYKFYEVVDGRLLKRE